MNEEAQCLTLNWQALAAVATFTAVLVALAPVWRESRRIKSRARSLRFRLCSQLTLLRPSLQHVVDENASVESSAILPKKEFARVVQSISDMMMQTEALESDEQDQLGLVLVNLELASVLYSESLDADSAKEILMLTDRAITTMNDHGLLTANIAKPWDQ